jgi:mono/diheme cytochrome c family protein
MAASCWSPRPPDSRPVLITLIHGLLGALALVCTEGLSAAEFYRGVNLNGSAVVIDGYPWDGDDTAANFVCKDKGFQNQDFVVIPPADPERSRMIRSSRWGGNESNVKFTDVPAGRYSVFLYVWEDNNPETFDISVNGRVMVKAYRTGSKGEWEKLGPWMVDVAQGEIHVSAKGGAANFSGVEIWRGEHDGTDLRGQTPENLAFFENCIRPLLIKHCYECHSVDAEEVQGGLLVDSRAAIRKGGPNGPAVVPGDLNASRLIEAVHYQNTNYQMPPDGKLSDAEIADLEDWVRRGAPDPRDKATRIPRKKIDVAKAREFWSLRPIADPAPPVVDDPLLTVSDIDCFVQAKREQFGLPTAPLADRRTLLRRVTFDLTGLPPTPEAIQDFLHDESPTAWSTVIDRLLASRQYAERWGRHWMDLVRYADTAGDNSDYPVPQAYLYRNYIIEAFHRDKPYDQFLREQIAGDLLPAETDEQRNEQIIATGYVAISRRFGSIVKGYPQHLTIEDTLDNIGRTVLAHTLTCARCHDHKFDPITQDDYYGLYGIFESTRYPFPGIELEKVPRDFVPLWKDGRPGDQLAYAVVDGNPGDARLHERGEPTKPADVIPRRFPTVLGGQALSAEQSTQSGRLQLADWLTDPANPLTARVMVNRIWQHHFGRGLVATPSDFGTRGQPPTHPELLDWLATRFIESGWSIKAMHRLMLHSRTYQLSSADVASPAFDTAREVDPDNRFLWRGHRQRLDAESLRDALLFVSGTLDDTPANEPHPFPPVDKWQFTQHHPFRDSYESNKRSVYLMTARLNSRPFFTTFDGADRNASTAVRDSSVTTLQSLYFLNDDFVHRQATAFAERVLRDRKDDASRLDYACELTLGRPPTDTERAAALSVLTQFREELNTMELPADQVTVQTWSGLARVLFRLNEFLYVD